MKQGINFETLARKAYANAKHSEDFIVDGEQLVMANENELALLPKQREVSAPSCFAHNHKMLSTMHDNLSLRLGIPKAYYRRMQNENPELLCTNVNTWLVNSGKHMIRTIQNDDNDIIPKGHYARALLSDRYRRIDNDQVLAGLMNKVSETDFKVNSCQITETNMFLKINFPFAQAEVAKGDIVESGVVIKNSEVGFGACSVSLFVQRLVCTNGMVLPESLYQAKKYHAGPRQIADQDYKIVSERTKNLEDQAFLSSLHDVIDTARNEKTIINIANKFKQASADVLSGDYVETTERLSKRLLINQNEQTSVLEHFLTSGDFSRWGFANAVTRTAQDIESYDRASELEKIGGQVIEMQSSEFMSLAA
ncbi:MAG: DUF932 domain-containing protein [Betaproteobacteria bacterium]